MIPEDARLIGSAAVEEIVETLNEVRGPLKAWSGPHTPLRQSEALLAQRLLGDVEEAMVLLMDLHPVQPTLF